MKTEVIFLSRQVNDKSIILRKNLFFYQVNNSWLSLLYQLLRQIGGWHESCETEYCAVFYNHPERPDIGKEGKALAYIQ